MDLQDCEVTLDAGDSGNFSTIDKKKTWYSLELASLSKRHIFLSKAEDGTSLKLSKVLPTPLRIEFQTNATEQAHKMSWQCHLRSDDAQVTHEWAYSLSVVIQRKQVSSALTVGLLSDICDDRANKGCFKFQQMYQPIPCPT